LLQGPPGRCGWSLQHLPRTSTEFVLCRLQRVKKTPWTGSGGPEAIRTCAVP
ncbi:hypothetical protein STEG23_031524, partial [Scotinomys teguina]